MATEMNKLNILLGVTGGIAAYKAVDLASKLTTAGAKVNCVMTESASQLVNPKSFETVTGQPVFMDLWSGSADHKISHIDLAQQTNIVVVAPATANILGKVANGICDDLLSTTLCTCWQKPVLFAPAMNTSMWTSPAVQKNVEALKQMKFEFIGPETGRLACGIDGIGRISEPSDILERIGQIAGKL